MPFVPAASPQVYVNPGLDRAAHRRRDAAWLDARRRDPGTRVVFLSDLKVAIIGPEEAPYAYAPSLGELGESLPEEAVFLGEREGAAWFALDLGDRPPPAGRPMELRAVSLLLPAGEAAMLAEARALGHWHRSHRHCGWCGTATLAVQGGHARRCPGCGREHFPRTDPAVIVLVTHGEQCLLARSPRFPPGMYSTLAGFVEPGESLEQTLAREVLEEVGVEIESAIYRGSQPWPFPQSLMLGFRAQARSTRLVPDPEEIEDARWLGRAELLDEPNRPVRLPSPDSIARFLIEEWLAEVV
ncbi:NAD(+) diphosphatase [Benzoatithermus flavus]|uniref:NAD(+) diphosphatase n=1 Tax=Benzoatithermus flavus TaxID=3108223 RepID=A0ABU8XNA1_9PROT